MSMQQRALDLLQSSSCYRDDVCGSLPCACAESIAKLVEAEIERLQAALAQAERSRDGWIDVNAAAGVALTQANNRIGEMRHTLQALVDDPATPPWIHTLVAATLHHQPDRQEKP